tara:strand:- start:1774 stop:2154 length:381 start_codon:yes stop_codon:yes gene_type:complete
MPNQAHTQHENQSSPYAEVEDPPPVIPIELARRVCGDSLITLEIVEDDEFDHVEFFYVTMRKNPVTENTRILWIDKNDNHTSLVEAIIDAATYLPFLGRPTLDECLRMAGQMMDEGAEALKARRQS